MEEVRDTFELNDEAKPYNIAHRSYYFARSVIQWIKSCSYDKIFSSLFDQLIRSASSIGANLVEGKAGSSKRDWRNYYSIALKSANETQYWLCLIRDTMDVDQEKAGKLLKEVEEIAKIIARILINSNKE